MRKPREILRYGPNGLLLNWEQRISPAIGRSVQTYSRLIRRLPGVVDCVAAYASLLATVDPALNTTAALREYLYAMPTPSADESITGRLHRLPVWYGEAAGPDLPYCAEQLSMSMKEVVTLHTSRVYYAYQLGYLPGFAFLGNVSERIQLPRRVKPRARVPAGSVAMAGAQTAVYPSDAPGGWQLLGRCPLPMLDLTVNSPTDISRVQPGDEIQFISVTAPAYREIANNPTAWRPGSK